MASHFCHEASIHSVFLNPLVELDPLSDSPFDCPKISDLDFLKMGVSRCMSTAVSGHDFLQTYRTDAQEKVRVSNFFEALKSSRRLNLKTHHLGYLDLAQPKDGKKSEHDMKMLKRQEFETLRARAPKGHRVLYLWDRACIDYSFWNQAKNQKGIYFATLEKSNSVTKFIRELNIIDYGDSRNEGLISDRLVETSKGHEVRQIIYVDPATGTRYRYLTNEKSLPAWVIVLLYKHRWDIEKVFDEMKTKLEEKRSWASSTTAKKMHANFLCLTHNLMLLLENHLCGEEQMSDEVEKRKEQTCKKSRAQSTGFRKRLPTSYIKGFFKRASQRTFRFIRWLRDELKIRRSYGEALRELADVWGCQRA